MPDKTRLVDKAELARFGQELNDLRDSDLAYEIPDAHHRLAQCSLDDVINSFQIFDGKSESFMVKMIFNEDRPGMMCKTIQYNKGPVTNHAAQQTGM